MTLQFWHSVGGPAKTVLEYVVNDFNRDSSSTQVELKAIDPSVYANAANEALELAPEDRPAFILAPEYLTGRLLKAIEGRVALSVDSLLDEERRNEISEFVSKTFSPHCLPLNPACGILYVNKEMLNEAGYSVDWKPESLEDIIEASKKIHEKNGVSGVTCAWPEAYLFEVMLAQENKPFLNVDGTYNFSQFVDRVALLRKLVQDKVLLPPNPGNYDPTRKDFVEGRTAFYMQGSGHSSLIAKEAPFDVGYHQIPTLALGHKGPKNAFPLGGAAVWVLNRQPSGDEEQGSTEEKPLRDIAVKGVREFINYLASKKTQAYIHQTLGSVPVNKTLREYLGSDYFNKNPIQSAVIAQTIESPFGDNSFGIKKDNWGKVRPLFWPLVHKLITKNPVDETSVAAEIESVLKEFDAKVNASDFDAAAVKQWVDAYL